MILNLEIAQKTAELLLQVKAIKLKPQNPFTWSSGWQSPIYCDNRVILSHPKVRSFVAKSLAEQLTDHYGTPDVIAGVATGAIGIGAIVAHQLNLPFVYVRPEAKKHGRKNQIEGFLEPGQEVVVVEDLISTGKSSLNAVKALKKSEAKVKGLLAIFSYGFDVAKENFGKENVQYHTLSDYETLIQKAVNEKYLKEEDLETLREWRKNPSNWKSK